MAKPMATGKELKRLRDKGLEATPENLRKVKEELRKEAMSKADKANRKGMKAGPAVSEPAGKYAKGGMVKAANCGASTKATQKGTYSCGGMVKKK